MRKKSVYCVECICGQHIHSQTPILSCPGCGREVSIVWLAEVDGNERMEPNGMMIAA